MKPILQVGVLVTSLCLMASDSQATTVLIGTLSYDTFIPGSSVSPGIDAINLSNLTGGFDLPPDFPVSDSLTFQSASLTLTFGDLSQHVFALGDVGPGFLLDAGGNPVLQVPGDEVLAAAEFTAILSSDSFALSDGTIFKAGSTSVDVVLQPSSGTALVADTDQTTIGVSETIGMTPELPSFFLILLPLVWLPMHCRRKWARCPTPFEATSCVDSRYL